MELKLAEQEFKDCKNVLELRKENTQLSEQAVKVLNGSDTFDELGRMIFLDRYALKSKRETIKVGDLVIAITLEDPKYPKKDLGIVKELSDDDIVTLKMITGKYACEEEKFIFKQSLWKCSKPIESVDDTYQRVASAVASVEKDPETQQKMFNLFYEELKNKRIQPAGRIMTGANVEEGRYTANLTLYNCYVIPCPKDSRKGIIETLSQMIEIMSRGGGVGISLASLRPRYSYVQGVHGQSSGSVSWGGLYSYATALVEQGGSRRGALMLMQADWHPDILDFISSKTKMGQIENANISVMVSDRFMEALKNDESWSLEFPDYEFPGYKEIYEKEWKGDLKNWKEKGYPTKIYKTIKAKELWDKLVSSAWASAEPGLVFMERYNKMSNSHYFNPVICTNPCGEQGLPGWGVCNLGHLYLASFAKKVSQDNLGPLCEMNWELLRHSAKTLARFLDNVIDLTPYFFKENEENQKNERRVGGGTLGLGELLIKLRLKYGSNESVEFIDKVYREIAVEMYKESSRIAKEKGSFPKFEKEKFLQSGFMKQMPEDVRQMIYDNGVRNVTLTTQAPTGTVGSMLGTSTGIEPYYAFEFFRQSRLGFHKVLIPLAGEYKIDNGLPEFFVSATSLGPLEHIKVQAAVQKWTDSSISKTANAPANFSVEETKELYEKAYDLGCKGVTIYRDGSRNEQILSTSEETEKKNLASARGELTADLKDLNVLQKAEQILKLVDGKELGETQREVSTENSVTVEVGAEVNNICPNCNQGVMVKNGGCTECSAQCGFTGSCDLNV